ncbi:transmembrane protein 272-like [Ornithodoros turicata]|uniref:transmembrane protein 272-like n=1 Tax=Ornithodoros turicata TaxID=34597 RepID=UPI003139CC60
MSSVITIPAVSYGTITDESSELMPKAECQKSFLGKLREATEDGPSETLVAIFEAGSTHVLHVATIVLKLILCIPMVAIGFEHMGDCPLEPALPFMLMIGGVILILTVLLSRKPTHDSRDIADSYTNFITAARVCTAFVLNGSLVGIFIIACFLVYPNVWPGFSVTDGSNYCHPVIFLFSFWLLNLTLALILIIAVFVLCILCYIHIFVTDHVPADADE